MNPAQGSAVPHAARTDGATSPPPAVLGGAPAFAEPLHVGRPNLGDQAAFQAKVTEIFGRRWLTNAGPVEQEFERRLAAHLGVRNVIAICNGTVALELAVRALDLRGEVIVPSCTFVATAHSLQWQQVTPVFAEIDPRTHNLDPADVVRRITPRTSGIMGVHLWGRPCAIDELTEIARDRGLRLMFDAAHAFDCWHGGRRIGAFGSCEVFSFHATKVFHTFEGGAITTEDDDLAKRIRLMKNFGFAGFDRVVSIGTNGKMTEVQAAMGLVNLDALSGFIAANRRNHAEYTRGLAGLPGVHVVAYDEANRNNHHYVILEIDPAAAALTRDELVSSLHAERVIARRYFFPGAHRMEPYATLYPDAGRTLPKTEALVGRMMSLPNGTAMSAEAVAKVCERIRAILGHAPQVRKALAAA